MGILHKIRIFTTGGTIDKHLLHKNQSAIHQLLKNARVHPSLVITENLLAKLSDDLTHNDRLHILEKCRKCKQDKIIITHGTSTMCTTAQLLGKAKLLEKCIVLTGAIVPSNEEHSDALFNLGCAFGAVQVLSNGVYVAMNGRLFHWDNVKKNRETKMFEEITNFSN